IGDPGSGPTAEGLRLYPFWLGPGGDVLQTAEQRPLVEPNWYPPGQWRVGEVVVTEMLPWDIGPEFRLALAVLDAEGNRLGVEILEGADQALYAMEGGTWLRMAAFHWVDGQVRPIDETAALAHPLDVEFGGSLRLAGYDVAPARPAAGGELALRLSWSRSGPAPEQDYTHFVHLLDAEGRRVAQGDGPPGYLGTLPTTLWPAGVQLLDRHVVPLPADLPAGDYSLLVGWYDPASGERLLLPSGEDALRLDVVLK
ncbi:MAG: hypothetical protein P8129_25955, partial [Anaerolineae bacterium]